MTAVFLCGPWACGPIRERLLPGEVRDGSLPGLELVTDASWVFPCSRICDSGVSSGVIGAADDAAWGRICYLADVLDWTIVPRRIAGARVMAVLPPEGPPDLPRWELEAWADRWQAIAAEAIDELMDLRDRRGADVVRGQMQMVYARAEARVAARTPVPATVRSATRRDTVEVIGRQTPHAGFFLTRAYELRHPGFAGGMSPQVRREVFVATDAAIVLPYDPRRDRVLLVEQFRMGPFGRGDARPWMLEPVAGRVDGGEDPAVTARRECEEEAGLALRGLEHISSHYCSPGCSTEYFHLFLGLCDLPEVEKGQGGLESEDEDIRTHVLGFEQAMDLLHSGEADNGPLVLSLLWLQRERARLRASA
ncbi:NUDIX domain-containing protein [Roseovarius sp. MMSF_3281]|uniref:NUDIX domain-containing protein n=1 Tax=Roseovarius sp. MMSF_3281 TaxID=3046694 RepID=UPI002740171E|nr:NUDIX domain-containing protein [Roseovarius sp. MMSF_3281]